MRFPLLRLPDKRKNIITNKLLVILEREKHSFTHNIISLSLTLVDRC